MQKRRTLKALAAAAFAALAPVGAYAAYPEKPINMIVAYSAGGATDLIARAMIPYMEKSLGNGAKIVVLNKTGAGGEIGFAQLANAAPDGYTIGLINSPPVVTIPIERPGSYHWEKYDLLGNLIDDPGGFTVHKDSKIRTIADLVAEAKKRPGQVSVATTGSGSDDHLAMVLLERQAGVKFNHIPYKGGADVRQSLTGKQIEVASMNIGEGIAGQKAGMPFHNLGQAGVRRADIAPDVPTLKESGFDIEVAVLRGIAAPKGLPADIRQKLVKAVADAVNDPTFVARAREYYNPIRYLAPADFARELKAAEETYMKMWKTNPWTEK